MERINKAYLLIGLVIATVLFFELAAHAEPLDEATTITLSQPVQVPGHTLAAGLHRL